MITAIPIRIKYGKKLELHANYGPSISLTHQRSLEHAKRVAAQIGWELASSTDSTKVVAYAPEPPVIDQIVDFFLLRGMRTSFLCAVDKASYDKIELTIFVAQPKPFAEDKTASVIDLVLRGFSSEFIKDGVALTWVHFDKAAFQRDLEESLKKTGRPQIPKDLSKYESRIRVEEKAEPKQMEPTFKAGESLGRPKV